jgi:hypothetical protein
LLRDFELDRTMSLLLHHNRASSGTIAVTDVFDSKLNKVTGAKLAIEAKIA